VTTSRTQARNAATKVHARQVPRGKKASWLPRRRLLFAEGVETGALVGVRVRKVSSSFQHTSASMTEGCSTGQEEGSHLSPFAGTAYEWGVGPSLASRRPTRHGSIASTILGATDGGIRNAASHAARRRAVVFGA